jgi:hypothetical protein
MCTGASCEDLPHLFNLTEIGIVCKNTPCKASQRGKSELQILKGPLSGLGTIQWRVTEAYPPTSHRPNVCYSQARCIDVLPNDLTKNNIITMCNALRTAGLTMNNGIGLRFSNAENQEVQRACGTNENTVFGHDPYIRAFMY